MSNCLENDVNASRRVSAKVSIIFCINCQIYPLRQYGVMADQTRFSSDRRDNPQSMQHILMPPKQATLYPTMAHPFHTSGYYPHPGPFAPHPQSFEPFIQQQPYIPFPPPNNFRVPLAPVSPGLVNFQAERPTDPVRPSHREIKQTQG